MAYRTRPQPKTPRRAILAGAPRPADEVAEVVEEKPKKRTTRKRAPKSEAKNE